LNAKPGTGYRVRVVSTLPALNGVDNGVDITIHELPNATISDSSAVCQFETISYTTPIGPSYKYKWTVSGGTISGASDKSEVDIVWTTVGNGKPKIVQTTPAGCKDSIEKTIIVKSLPTPVIDDHSDVCLNEVRHYTSTTKSFGY
jgi:hypothetical protein